MHYVNIKWTLSVTYRQDQVLPGEDRGLLVVEIVPEVLVNGLQLFQYTTLWVVAIVLEGEATPYVAKE